MVICCMTYKARRKRSNFFMVASHRIGYMSLIHILLLFLHFRIQCEEDSLSIFISEIQNIAETTLQQQMNLLHTH